MPLSGLLIMADWLASNTELFPLLSVEDLKPDDKLRAERAWAKLNFPQMWNPERTVISNEDFKETFGFEPRSVQSEVLKIVENSENPGIYIFEAPMGCGKTETSLAASEILASKCGKNGVFFGLPTQATANGIFPRILSWAEKQSTELYHSVQLNHGSAALNSLFQNSRPSGNHCKYRSDAAYCSMPLTDYRDLSFPTPSTAYQIRPCH